MLLKIVLDRVAVDYLSYVRSCFLNDSKGVPVNFLTKLGRVL